MLDFSSSLETKVKEANNISDNTKKLTLKVIEKLLPKVDYIEILYGEVHVITKFNNTIQLNIRITDYIQTKIFIDGKNVDSINASFALFSFLQNLHI